MSGMIRTLIAQVQNKRFTTADEGYTLLPVLQNEAVPRNGVIVIRSHRRNDEGECFVIELNGEAFGCAKSGSPIVAAITLSKTELVPHVDLCRRRWNEVIDEERDSSKWLPGKEKPLVARVAQEQKEFGATAKRLAIAGRDLFNAIFLRDDPQLPELCRKLVDGLSNGPCFLTVYSDGFFLPWGMLYVHPPKLGSLDDDSVPCQKEGFLGYSHVIEHSTDSFVPSAAIKSNNAGIDFGFTYDAAIDKEQGLNSIEQQREYFRSRQGLRSSERASKADLASAFKMSPFRDQISYFFLHGRTSDVGKAGTPPCFFIGTDAIDAAEINSWISGRKLDSQPLMFFNTCQTGQMRSLFYESFAMRLLDLQARGLIGPQIDVPTVFAQEYARRFFDKLLTRRDTKDIRVGHIVRALAQQFYDSDNNPLGLTYSLFKGADCYISW